MSCFERLIFNFRCLEETHTICCWKNVRVCPAPFPNHVAAIFIVSHSEIEQCFIQKKSPPALPSGIIKQMTHHQVHSLIVRPRMPKQPRNVLRWLRREESSLLLTRTRVAEPFRTSNVRTVSRVLRRPPFSVPQRFRTVS